MAAYGVPEAGIARVVQIARMPQIDPKTLRKRYRDDLDTSAIKATSKIAESLYRKAIGDGPQSVIAAIFWLKTRAAGGRSSVRRAATRSTSTRTPMSSRSPRFATLSSTEEARGALAA